MKGFYLTLRLNITFHELALMDVYTSTTMYKKTGHRSGSICPRNFNKC